MPDITTSQLSATTEQTLALQKMLQQAIDHHQSGNLEDAETLYRNILEVNPDHAEANHNLGALAVQVEQAQAALPYLTAALQADPAQQRYWLSYIQALVLAGEMEGASQALELGRQHGVLQGEAVDRLAKRIAVPDQPAKLVLEAGVVTVTPPLCFQDEETTQTPSEAQQPAKPAGRASSENKRKPSTKECQALLNCVGQRKFGKAETMARTLTLRCPNDGFGWKMLALALLGQQRTEEAEAPMRRAANLLPNDPDVHSLLGLINNVQKQPSQAEPSLRRAVQLQPNSAVAHYELGYFLFVQHRFTESAVSLRRAIEIGPDTGDMHYYLGTIFRYQNRLTEAEASLRRAVQLDPDLDGAHRELAGVCQEQGRYAEAEVHWRRMLELAPDNVDAYRGLVSVLVDQGRLSEAEACTRRGIALEADSPSLQTALLFTLNYDPDKSAEEIFAAYRDYNELLGLPHHSAWRDHENCRSTARRLKVGYVSPDFRRHSMSTFLEPLLAHHDKQVVEVYLYAELSKTSKEDAVFQLESKSEDAETQRYRTYADHWIPTVGLSDEALAERIRADGIDILVDLAGHTMGNRLKVFARKPAPVSLSWLGYGYTTGLTAIDYFLTDSVNSPEGSESLFSEAPWRLATPGFVYRRREGMGAVSPLPAARHGKVTFGTLTRAIRINHRTIRVWSEILKRVDNAQLLIDSLNFQAPETQALLTERFAAHGIGPERLVVGFHSPPWDLLREMDIGLDCFPHNSGTTLFETLYMGVPYITLAGRPSVGRLGSSILEGVGHPEWIARSEEEYIEKAVALASDLPALAAIRAGLRSEMEAGPLMDEPGFARKVEAAYREMWIKWSSGDVNC